MRLNGNDAGFVDRTEGHGVSIFTKFEARKNQGFSNQRSVGNQVIIPHDSMQGDSLDWIGNQ